MAWACEPTACLKKLAGQRSVVGCLLQAVSCRWDRNLEVCEQLLKCLGHSCRGCPELRDVALAIFRRGAEENAVMKQVQRDAARRALTRLQTQASLRRDRRGTSGSRTADEAPQWDGVRSEHHLSDDSWEAEWDRPRQAAVRAAAAADDLEPHLRHRLALAEPTAEDQQHQRECVQTLQAWFHAQRPRGCAWLVEPFGSAVNGFGLRGSDLDIQVSPVGGGDAAYATTNAAGRRAHAVALLRWLKETRDFDVLHTALGARVPVVRLWLQPLEVDVTASRPPKGQPARARTTTDNFVWYFLNVFLVARALAGRPCGGLHTTITQCGTLLCCAASRTSMSASPVWDDRSSCGPWIA